MQLMLVMVRLAETLTLDILGSRVRNLILFIRVIIIIIFRVSLCHAVCLILTKPALLIVKVSSLNEFNYFVQDYRSIEIYW